MADRCVKCKKPLTAGVAGRCYECATGKTRVLMPRVANTAHDWMRDDREGRFRNLPRDVRPYDGQLLEP